MDKKSITEVLENIEQKHPKHSAEIKKYLQILELPPIPYIACFSEDGDLMSQWRAYADDGNGIAVGFKLSIPQGLPLTYAGSDILKYSLTVEKVIYDYNTQFSLVNTIINQAVQDKPENIFLYANRLKQLSYICKHQAFREEKEWRIINTPLVTSDFKMCSSISDLKFRATRNKLISFLELPIRTENKIATIAEIVVGPKNNTLPDTLNNYLNFNNYRNIIIKKSDSPYQ